MCHAMPLLLPLLLPLLQLECFFSSVALQRLQCAHLHQELEVHVVALGRIAVLLAVAATGLEVDTLCTSELR